MRELRLMSALTVLVFLCVSQVLAQREAVTPYASHTTVGNTVTISCSGTHKVRLVFCRADIVRVEFDPKGAFTLPTYTEIEGYNANKVDLATYMTRSNYPAVAVTPSDAGSYLLFKTSRLSVRVVKNPLRIQFYSADNTTLLNSDDAATGMECQTGGNSLNCDLYVQKLKLSTEHFFGFGNMNRMECRPIDYAGQDEGQNPTGCPYANGADGEHYASPFFYSTQGYGMFAIFDRPLNSGWQMPWRNTNSQTYWDMGKTSTARYSVRYWKKSGGVYTQYLIYYFFMGPSWREVIDGYDFITGRPPLFAKKMYGVQANNFPGTPNAKAFEDFVTGYRNGKFPLDLMVLDDDNNWGSKTNTTMNGYSWFPNAGTTYWTGALNQNGDQMSAWFRSKNLIWGGNLHDEVCYPDRAAAVQAYVDHGFDIYWRDMTGNSGVFREAKTSMDHFVKAHNGDTSLAYVRQGWATWAAHAYGYYHAGDANGQGALIKSQLISGLAGYTTSHIDIGIGPWGCVAHSLMAPIFYHPYGRGDDNNRSDSRVYNLPALTQANFKTWMAFHYQMLPYLYTGIAQSSLTGVPLWRHMVIEDPQNSATWTKEDQAYVGDWLLVAPYLPTIHANSSRSVWLPAGVWYDWFAGTKYTGPATITYNVTGYKLPLFAREGAIVPMGPSMEWVGQVKEDPITLNIWPAGTTSFSLCEDENRVTSTFVCVQGATQTAVVIPPFKGSRYSDSTRKYILQVHTATVPLKVFLNNAATELTKRTTKADLDAQASGWFHDAANGGVCYVKPNGTAAAGFTVYLSYDGNVVGVSLPMAAGTAVIRHSSVTCKNSMLSITIPFAGRHSVDLYDAAGRSVKRIEGCGARQYRIPAAANSVKIYRITAGSAVTTGRAMTVR